MIGSRLGNWIIEKELGRGGMGQVYLAYRDTSAGEPANGVTRAAIKILAAELAQEKGFLQRFQREIQALAQLDHPNIVHFYESGLHEGFHYYAMECIIGRNFDELMRDRGRLPWKEVLDMALQVCSALKHAHDHGIIHRDIKPQNLMRTDAGVVKLADFGVAKVFASRQLTATGGLVGTAEYISPEQAAGKPVTIRSDLYSFGVVMYTLLTGRMPFKGKSVLDLIHKHRYAQFDRPQSLVLDLPHEMDDLVCMLMEKDPAQRPANALVLHRQLESIHRKLNRKEQLTDPNARSEQTLADNEVVVEEEEPGPATLMSHMMREELLRQGKGGPLARLLGHPAVLVPLFLLCSGLLLWGIWPVSARQLYERGAALMDKDDPADWVRAKDYFDKLDHKFPQHEYAKEVKEYLQQIEDERAATASLKSQSADVPLSEAHRFYVQGLRYRKEGNFWAAHSTWEKLVLAFQGIESEVQWVRLAKQGLEKIHKFLPSEKVRWAPILEQLEKTSTMPRPDAEKVWQSIEDLYRNDPSAGYILEKIKDYRDGKR